MLRTTPSSRASWLEVLSRREVWRRALLLGLPVGLIQVALNQGDHWVAGPITRGLVFKSVASPCLSTAIALVSAAYALARQPAAAPASAKA